MSWPPFVWLMLLPIVSSPFVYIVGRLLQRSLEGLEAHGGIPAARLGVHPGRKWRSNPVRWVSLAILLCTLVPLVFAGRELAQGTVAQFSYGIIALRFDGISFLLAAAVLSLGVLVSLFSGPYIGHEGGQEKYHALLNTMIGAMIGLGARRTCSTCGSGSRPRPWLPTCSLPITRSSRQASRLE